MQKKIAVLLSLVVLFSTILFLSPKTLFASGIPIKAYLYQTNNCYYPDCISSNQSISLKLIITYVYQIETQNFEDIPVKIFVNGTLQNETAIHDKTIEATLSNFTEGVNEIEVKWKANLVSYTSLWKESDIYLSATCSEEQISLCSGERAIDDSVWKLCSQVPAESLLSCQKCLVDKGIWTAVGCIPTDSTQMIRVLIKIGLLIGGGVALLIILMGAFSLSISEGDPKKTSEAKDQITAAIIGLIFIIFSISILQLIGVQILHIPEFGQ